MGLHFRYLSDEDGATLPEPGRWLQIVGVVENMESNAMDAARSVPVVFHPLARNRGTGAMMIVRFPGGVPAEFAGRMRGMAATLDPSLRVGLVRSLDAAQREEGQVVRLIGLALTLVTVTVLLLSAAGIYALMSFTVSQRRKEIGIRAALGAHPRRLLAGIFARAIRQLALGLAAGIGLALLLDSAADGELLGGRGAVLFPVVAAVMGVVGLLAAAGPARRGLRIQPSEALRAEG